MFGIHSMYSGVSVASQWNGLSGLFRFFFSTPGTLASFIRCPFRVLSILFLPFFFFFNLPFDKSIKLSHCFHSAVSASYATALSQGFDNQADFELDMINAISAAHMAFIMSSSRAIVN